MNQEKVDIVFNQLLNYNDALTSFDQHDHSPVFNVEEHFTLYNKLCEIRGEYEEFLEEAHEKGFHVDFTKLVQFQFDLMSINPRK